MASKKKIPCVYWGGEEGFEMKHLTMREIVQERNRLREAAFAYLKGCEANPKCKHVIYYRDRRNADDEVWQVHFYCRMRPCSDEVFYFETENADGFVGAVHCH